MKRILLIDYTAHHPEVIDALLRLFSGHAVTLIITESFERKYKADFAWDELTVLVKKKAVGNKEWLSDLEPLMQQQDVVIIATTLRRPLELATLRVITKAKKIAIVHNTYYFMQSHVASFRLYRRLRGEQFGFWKDCLDFLRQKIKYYRRRWRDILNSTSFSEFAKHIDFFAFGNECLALSFSKESGLKNVMALPIANARGDAPRPPYDGVLRAAIIGSVSPSRRDYETVLRALASVQCSEKFELHILGGCSDSKYAARLRAMIRAITDPNVSVFFSPQQSFIPIDELKFRLESMHLLLSPIRINFLFQLYCECYGKTKISGAEADCLVFNRPILLPSSYQPSSRIEKFVIQYRDEKDLGKIIGELQRPDRFDYVSALSQQSGMTADDDAFLEEFLKKIDTSGSG